MFQIDLGIALMNYAIEKEFKKNGKRPGWVRQMEFVPYDCKKCYFCLNGHTTGIVHSRKRAVTVVFANGVRLKTKKCVNVRVNIGKNPDYCKMCYRKQDPSLTYKERRKNCRSSRLGCFHCGEHVCKECWDEGYDMHKKSIE